MGTKTHAGTFSTDDTLKWIAYTWREKAKPRFEKFFHVLDALEVIPPHYLSKLTWDCSGWNPTFRFLRPDSVESIIGCLRKTKTAKKYGNATVDEIWTDNLKPFLDDWEKLFTKMVAYYGDKDIVQPVRDKFHLLRFSSAIFREEDTRRGTMPLSERLELTVHNRIIELDKAQYQHDFDDFIEAFSRLPKNPHKVASSKTGAVLLKEIAESAKEAAHHSKYVATKFYKVSADTKGASEAEARESFISKHPEFQAKQLREAFLFVQSHHIEIIEGKTAIKYRTDPNKQITIKELCRKVWNTHPEWKDAAAYAKEICGYKNLKAYAQACTDHRNVLFGVVHK